MRRPCARGQQKADARVEKGERRDGDRKNSRKRRGMNRNKEVARIRRKGEVVVVAEGGG
jgi:hypothetical protein